MTRLFPTPSLVEEQKIDRRGRSRVRPHLWERPFCLLFYLEDFINREGADELDATHHEEEGVEGREVGDDDSADDDGDATQEVGEAVGHPPFEAGHFFILDFRINRVPGRSSHGGRDTQTGLNEKELEITGNKEVAKSEDGV